MAKFAKLGIYRFCVLGLTAVVKLLFRARVIGRENIPLHGAIVVARHASFWDVPLVAVALHWRRCVTFVARRTLMDEHLWLKPWIAAFAIAVDRDRFRMSDFKRVVQAIEDGHWVAIFPEGSIQQPGKVHPGVMHFAQRTGREILPVRFRVRRGHFPPRYPLGFPALDLVIGKPFTIRDLEFDLSGDETKEIRARRLSELLLQRMDVAEAG